MDLGSNTLYLNKKYLGAVAIHAEINHVLGTDTIGYSTVTRYLRKQSFVDSSDCQEDFSSNDHSSVSFGQQDGTQITVLQMGPSQALGRSETDASRFIKKSLAPVAFRPTPGMELFRHLGRSWVLLLESA
jgi:hypothetical protein